MSRRNHARRRRSYAPRQRDLRRRRPAESNDHQAADGFGWRHVTDDQAATRHNQPHGAEG